MNGFELTDAERFSPLWQRLVTHARKQRDVLRARNDGYHDVQKTATLRGEIATYNALILLDTPKPPSRGDE